MGFVSANCSHPDPCMTQLEYYNKWTVDDMSSLIFTKHWVKSISALNALLHTGKKTAQYGLHSTVCTGNCVVCKGGIGDIAQTGLRSFAFQKFGRSSAQSCRLHRYLSPVCPCMPLRICTCNNVYSVIFHSAIMAPTVTEEYQEIFIKLYLPFHL